MNSGALEGLIRIQIMIIMLMLSTNTLDAIAEVPIKVVPYTSGKVPTNRLRAINSIAT